MANRCDGFHRIIFLVLNLRRDLFDSDFFLFGEAQKRLINFIRRSQEFRGLKITPVKARTR